MKKQTKILLFLLAFALFALVGCSKKAETPVETAVKPPQKTVIYLNGNAIPFAKEGNTDLKLLSVEKGITIDVEKDADVAVTVNGQPVDKTLNLDVKKITREDTLKFEVKWREQTQTYTVNLMPSRFPDYTTEGESTTDGDYYLSTYDMGISYIFKLNSKGELIFYKSVTKPGENGQRIYTNGLDFRKQTTSDGKVRYTYMPYLAGAFADGDCAGINPGCVVVMDENYQIIDEVYYKGENGEEIMIDPHGFVWLDENHYILTTYKQMTLDVPKDLKATDNKADLAVLFIQEIKDGEVLWEFSSAEYEKFLYESNSVTWEKSTERCYDYVHVNSMDIDKDGNLLVSCRHLDAILKINRENGDLMWQLGGDRDEFRLAKDQKFSYQHSIVVAENGDYLLFDNANAAVDAEKAEFSSVIRMTVNEETKKVEAFERHNVLDYYSIYMGAIRELDAENGVYLYAVGGNYEIDKKTPPEWSMIEYTLTEAEEQQQVEHLFKFRFNEGYRRLYSANKCK